MTSNLANSSTVGVEEEENQVVNHHDDDNILIDFSDDGNLNNHHSVAVASDFSHRGNVSLMDMIMGHQEDEQAPSGDDEEVGAPPTAGQEETKEEVAVETTAADTKEVEMAAAVGFSDGFHVNPEEFESFMAENSVETGEVESVAVDEIMVLLFQ